MIYLDNAATSFHKPETVLLAVQEALHHMGNSGRGAHGASLDASRTIFATRQLLAELFHAGDPSRVAFTANSTESLNMAIFGLFKPGDHVITTMLEHNSVLRPLYLLEQAGVELTILPADGKGCIRYDDLKQALRKNTRGIVCTHASNLTGNMLDIGRIGGVCRENDLLFLVDASQTAGVFDINIEEMGIDALCFTGHKSLLGPQGTGGIWVREGVSVKPLLVGGSGVHSYSKSHPEDMPAALEAGTLNGHGIAGLHAALCYLKETGIGRIRERELSLMKRFYEGVKGITGVTVYGDFSCLDYWKGEGDSNICTAKRAAGRDGLAEPYLRAPIVTINIRDYDSGETADELACRYGIYTRAGAHCAPLMHKALGTEAQGAVRFSMSSFNTEEEIDQAVRAVEEIAAE